MEQAAVTGITEHVVEYLTPLVPESVCQQKAGGANHGGDRDIAEMLVLRIAKGGEEKPQSA